MAANYRSSRLPWSFIDMMSQYKKISKTNKLNQIRKYILIIKKLLNFMVVKFLFLIIFLTTINISAEHVRELEVSENAPIGYQIGFIGEFLHGVDSGPPYLIVPVPGSAVDTDLVIDHTTGEIRTKVQLDRELRASYSLVAIPLSGENVRVIIRVLDENDNPPRFPTSVMNIEFPENTPRDVKRTLHPAKDLDLGRYNTQRYNIVSGNVNNAFRLSSHRERDGVLYLDLQINGFLDRETTPAYSLVIEAMDGGNPPLRGQMTVNITIQDVNDNQPIFNQSRYFATTPENATVGTSVLQVYASDTDAGENGLVEYSINRRQSDKIQMFRIDPHTGLISVNKPLDFETKELHELVVVAKDNGEQPLETTAFVSIVVTDVNDNQPTINVIFLSDDATPKISESAQPGEFVARISVNDPDSKTEYSNVNVTLSGGDGHFGLTTRDNIIYLVIVSLPLDRENQPNYTLNVIATDNGNPPLHASKTIYLRVTDINDNPPEFEKNTYSANVMEVADPGTSVLQVVAIDKDEGNNSAVIYSLKNTPETHSQWFQIDAHTGLITTRAHIDCETEPVPKLIVLATDSGHPPLSSSATVLVTIHDVNDNEPIFDQSFYNVTIAENEPVGRCILKVSASDPDCGVNAMVNYTLGDAIKLLNEFEVRSITGEICISGDLDYETRNSFEFPVIATDRGGLSTTAMVKIQLTDVNDNRPVFYPKEYNVSLRESSGILATSTPVVSVVATDLDSGRFGAVSYRIASGNEAGIFRIDRSTGEIFINRPNMLSSRTQSIHMLNISASDGGGLRTSQDAIIFISIIDATQRPPIFEKPRYHYYVKEDVPVGTVIGSVLAADSDSGSHSIIKYSIYSGDPDNYFNIDTTSGNIRIAKPLDHESKPQVLLNIQATSGDPPAYGHTQVNIDIEDVNDNPPEFESNIVRISVPENVKLGTPLYAANAQDKDSGKSGIITYSIATIDSIKNYNTNNSNGMLNLSSISSTSLLLPTSSSSHETLLLNAKNSFNQQYNQQQQQHQHSYNKNENGIIVNSIDLFSIDSRSGHLTLSRNLDFETSQRHSLIITATDSGVPPLSANLTILVEVQDVNDNPPIFERNEYSIKVIESMPINSQILQVTAIDVDTGNNARLTYRIIGGDQIMKNSKESTNKGDKNLINEIFGIFPNSGWIYLRATLDRETCDQYELSIMASDNGTPTASAQTKVVINILDANDNDPIFSKNLYEFIIEENQKRGSSVGQIHATDLDLNENAAIQYVLIPSNSSFQINSITGVISTTEPLDRESRSNYDLVAEARDQGTPYRSSRVNIKITVSDVNDNAPEIVDPQEDVVSVREEQPPGTEVVKVRAIDRDNGNNATVTYSILKGRDSDGFGLFVIDPNLGTIRTRVVLDHEERSIYRLVIAATDSGKPPKQNVRLLRVEVLDLNDNRPTFTSSSLVFRVREDVAVGYVVGSIGPNERNDNLNTISNNMGSNGLYITYTLTPLTKDVIEGAFDIDRRTGSLVVARQLDREQQSEFRLEIRALDTTATNNPQSSAITVKVEIADVNDNAPEWTEDPIIIKVNEDLEIGEILYNFTAHDADSGTNGELQYKLVKHSPQSDSKIFSIDPLTGALTLQIGLDYETVSEYILIVQALDQSSNHTERLTTTVTAKIILLDSNDNSPIFIVPSNVLNNRINDLTETSAEITISDAIQVGDVVTHIVAHDNDSGDNGRISYNIINGNEDSRFRIDQQTGVIELIKSLTINDKFSDLSINDDYNYRNYYQYHQQFQQYNMNNGNENDKGKNNKFNLIISASDHGTPISKKTHLNLKILVQGTTSNPPRFLQSVYHANISENIQSGSFVLRVGAKLFNGGDTANLTYFIPPGVADNHFQIDSMRGIITTRGQFDRELINQYEIPIYVFKTNLMQLKNDNKNYNNHLNIKNDENSIISMNGQFDVATIMVKITDVNDHAPEYRPGSCYPLAVPENSDLAVIHTVVATDLDEGLNGEIIYSIIGGNLGNKFSIDMHTGELTARSLDREQYSRYVLQIQAQDRGSPITYQGHCNITVIVEDQNDNDPRFEQSKYVINIPEDLEIGSSILQVHANDADSGINSRLIYSLANETQWLFAIDNRSGLITTVGPLDRERQYVYDFMVIATDGGRYDSRSQHVPVQIIIDDVNDNKPIFEHYPFMSQVPSLIQPGQTILHVLASDLDQGINGEILYSLINDSTGGKFRINPNTGALSATQSLASENGRLFRLEVIARDKGNPPKSSIGLIEIRVGEHQNGAPLLRFQNETYSVKLKENTASGNSVVQVNAVRSDGRRQKIIYSIGAGNEDGSFSIDSITGEIKVQQSIFLDFERCYLSPTISENMEKSYNNNENKNKCIGNESNTIKLIVIARTDNSPTLYGYAELHIELEDENDNSPHFTQEQYSATVWEGNNKGTFVIQVQAVDADFNSNARVLYHIVDGNHDNAFIIEPAFSGIVKTNIVLDREIRDLYRLKVIATDEGVPQMTGTATIRVQIVDVNDNQPTFPPNSIVSVSEDTEVGTVITTVSANDVDTNPALTYRFSEDIIIKNNNSNKNNKYNNEEDISIFAIDRYSGKVILKKRLDYEKQQEYQLEIIASDTSHEAKTILTVRVTDVNDNAPIFKQPAYYVALLPDQLSSNDIELLTVNATDIDGSEQNSKISYKISSNVNGFTINEHLGIIYVNASRLLNNNTTILMMKKDIYLTVIAMDSGKPKLQSSTIVRVQLNSNSNGLTQFLQSQYRLQINENTKLGTEVFKLSKDIIDSEQTNNLQFDIVSGNDDLMFEVYQSRAIILVKQLDREQNDLYKLQLVMNERGSMSSNRIESNSTAINLFVTIEDENDNEPIFQQNVKYEAEISELAPLRYSIAKILATDADAENTPNSEVVYDITSGNDEGMFTIDLVTGVLFVNNKLDYDSGSSKYELILRACDSAIIAKCSLNSFNIQLTDENDNTPRFPVTEYVEFLGENEPIGTSIFTARATDLDKGKYGELNYTLISANNEDWKLFRVDSKTGVVTSQSVFDYEQRTYYSFNLKSTDIGGLDTTTKVKIFVDSRDEFIPQFTERTYRFTLASNSYVPIGYVVGQIQATDRDKGPDGRIVYQLNSQHAYFKVNRTTGAIILKKKIDSDFDNHDIVSLVISASSGRQGSLSNMSVVEICLDPLGDAGTNLASSGNVSGSFADWALGLFISFLLIIITFGAVYVFLHMRNKRRLKQVSKPNLSTETVGNSNSYVDPSTFDTIPIRGGSNAQGSGSNTNKFAPPKYDEIPPYGPTSSNSGAATTSELSGSEQSGSSGRGSAEDDGEDEEIRMINEGNQLRRVPEHLHDDGRLSGLSIQNTQEYLARLGIVDNTTTGAASTSSRHCSESIAGSNKEQILHHPTIDALHIFNNENGTESDITNLIYAKLNDVVAGSDRASSSGDAGTGTVSSIGPTVDHVLGFGEGTTVGSNHQGPSMTGSLSSIVHSEEELTGSYNWDYLLDWGPQYQPLAHVFSEIARLKDDTLSVHSGNSGASSAKSKSIITPKHIPPPLITNVAPRSVPVLSSRGSHHSASGLQYHHMNRSPLTHHDSPAGVFSTSSVMSPSFSPSLSPLATRSPSISPHVSNIPPPHIVPIPRQLHQQHQQHQQHSQASQRKNLETDLRIHM